MANNTNTTGEQSYASWEEGVANSLSDKLEISYSDAQGIIESNEFYMAQAWAKGMDSKQTADYIDSKSSMAKGGGVKSFEIYHKTLASALEEVEEWAARNGYTFTSENYFPDVTSGGVKYGETKRFKREVKKDGKNKEGDIAIQVYRMDSGTYELNLYPTFKRGGSIEDENLDMVKSQNKAISHHTKELQSQLNMGKDAPAWVVSKVSRASNDLSDVTHYLDGEKMAKGGKVVGYEVAYQKMVGGEYESDIKSFTNKEDADKFAKETYGYVDEVYENQYNLDKKAKGGKVKFDKTLISSLPKNRRADKNYTHFAVRKSDNKILNGWDYSEYDSEDLNTFKKSYFYDDMDDMDVPKNEYTIKKTQTLIRLGVNPFDFDNWRNLDFSNDKPYVESKMANGGGVEEEGYTPNRYPTQRTFDIFKDGVLQGRVKTNKKDEFDIIEIFSKDRKLRLLKPTMKKHWSVKLADEKYQFAYGGNINEWDEEQYPSRRKMLESILSKEFGSMNQYSSSADWGGIPVWSLSGDDLEGTFIGIGDDDGLFIVEREQDYEEGDTKETEIMTASYDEIPKMKSLIAKAKTMQSKMADGGVIKGSNNKTGERFGVVIGSETISDEYVENGLELNVRKVYGSRISESKLIFDEKGNLDGIVDYGYSVDGLPNLSMGRGTHYGADKKKTIQILSEMYTPSFAKNLVQSVYTKMAKGGKMANGGMIEIKKHGSLDNDNHIQYEVDVHEINPKFNHKLYGTIELDYEDKYFATYLNELFEKSEQEKHFETLEEAEKWVLGKMNKEKDEYIKDFGSKPANGGGDNEVVSFFKNIDYSKLPPAFTEYIKNEVLTDADLQYLSPKEPVFLEIKKKVEEYTNKSAVTTTATETGDSDEKKKVLQEIADLEGIKEFVSGDELNKINKELDDLNGLLPIL